MQPRADLESSSRRRGERGEQRPGVVTICERPARPAAAAHDPKVEASFRAFVRTWLEKMRKAGAAENAPGGRRQVRDEFETELRPTGSTLVRWVGILRYCEQTPFRAGKWGY